MTYATETAYPLQEAYDYTIDLIDSVFSEPEEKMPPAMPAKKAAGVTSSSAEKIKENIGFPNKKLDTDC